MFAYFILFSVLFEDGAHKVYQAVFLINSNVVIIIKTNEFDFLSAPDYGVMTWFDYLNGITFLISLLFSMCILFRVNKPKLLVIFVFDRFQSHKELSGTYLIQSANTNLLVKLVDLSPLFSAFALILWNVPYYVVHVLTVEIDVACGAADVDKLLWVV